MLREADLCIVGGGAGGLTAARDGARRGLRTLIVQDGPLGGDCTFTGCVPSKTLLDQAARGASFTEAMSVVRATVDRIAAMEDDDALTREGIQVVHGRAEFRSPDEIEVDGTRIRASRMIVATGSAPSTPPIPGLEHVDYLTSDSVWGLRRRPASLAALGGGPVGCELAQAFARLGSRVTLLEALDRVLVCEEPEVSALVAEALRADGVDVVAGASATRIERLDCGADCAVRLLVQGRGEIDADALLVATGRTPTSAGFGLEQIGVELDRAGYIRTDDTLATSVKGIWAIGDVTGRLPFTHAAAHMAFIAVSNATSRIGRRRFDAGAIPWVTFTTPQVGRVGPTEAEAAGEGARVAYVHMGEIDRAVVVGETRGFIKLIAVPRRVLGWAGGGRLAGATVVGGPAGEMIGELALAVRTRMFTGRLAQTVHAYPTWSVGIQQAAAQFFFAYNGRSARPAVRP